MTFSLNYIGFTIFRNWIFLAFSLALSGLFSTSCQKITTTNLIPDSCKGIIKWNLPKLLPKIVANPFVVDSLNHLTGLPLDEMGINFFQPAYLYQKSDSTDLHFVLALSDASKFSKVLAKTFDNQPIERQDEFSILWTGNWALIWNEDFLVGKKVDPMLGKPKWSPDWIQPFSTNKENPGSFHFDETNDFSWFWNAEEEFLGGVIPNLELKIKGAGSWNHPKLSFQATIEEHQYLALLHPFPMGPPSDVPLQAVVWPALESILLQIEWYGGNPFKTEMNSQILDLIKKMDHPFECLLVGNGKENLQNALQVKTRYSDEKLAAMLEKEIKSMLPKSVLSQYAITRNGGEISFYNQTSEPLFSTKNSSGPQTQNMVFGLFQKDDSMKTELKLQLKEPGKYELILDATHPERISGQAFLRQILSLQTEEILAQFLPNANEKKP